MTRSIIFEASIPVSVILFAGRIILPSKISLLKVPLSVIALEFLLCLVGTSGVRALRRLIFELREREAFDYPEQSENAEYPADRCWGCRQFGRQRTQTKNRSRLKGGWICR